ncbi:hypothetical protein D7Z54_23400 [Salibacterium salarium]|uniref:LysM domain-containing protein n=1 Tax=Salibacterium salarium TaxID=284579 RepID=A0A428MXQ1_9BACI|nr:hypothetical protein [Salibacterium salarium]RSL30920.1 hypothetical protein D7Z54_23400 [Salibacterium salarium]
MKKMLLFLLFVLVCTSIYYDITEGTLTTSSSPPSQPSDTLDDQTMTKVTVESGQTVLSIVERLHDGPIPVSIEQVSHDFKQLNDEIDPNNIKVDKSYHFPVYEP